MRNPSNKQRKPQAREHKDNLVAQALAGSTFPDQITVANNWIQQNSSLKGDQLMQAVDKQPWDASVKGLIQFPDVLGASVQQNQNRPSTINQTQREPACGYEQQANRNTSSSAFSGYSPGGNARTNSARGEQSLSGGRRGGSASRPQPAAREGRRK
jgi:hypothetical protein